MGTYIDSMCSCYDIGDGLTSITCIRKDTEEHEAGDVLLFHVFQTVNGGYDHVQVKSCNGSFVKLEFTDKRYRYYRGHYDYWRG